MIPANDLKSLVDHRGVSDTELEVLSLAIDGQSTAEIAKNLRIDAAAVRKRLGEVYRKFDIAGKGPGKLAKLQQVLIAQYQFQQTQSQQTHQQTHQQSTTAQPISSPSSQPIAPLWDGIPEVDAFYGRTAELAELETWIVDDRCRLIEVLGIGGIGKTTLSLELAKQVRPQFEQVIWRSLSHAPPLKEILADVLQTLSGEAERFERSDLIARLLHHLRHHRCLLILDGAENILCRETLAGNYQAEYQEYGILLEQIAKTEHQSCLVVTSGEKTQEFTQLEGKRVRAFHLQGLTTAEGHLFFKQRGVFANSEQDWQTIVQLYSGNPLALKIAAVTIQEVFGGDLTEFLKQGTAVFGDIRHLIENQFDRLSKLERHILYWLALNKEPVSLIELREDIVPSVTHPRLLEALESLGRRSLVERDQALFSLQPVVTEYTLNRFVDRVYSEIIERHIRLFNSHALIKAQAKDYIREQQIRAVVQPLLEKLIAHFGNETLLQQNLLQFISDFQQQLALKPGYLTGNVLNLFGLLDIDVSGCDFSHLMVRQAYLKHLPLHRVNFTGADLATSVFAEKLGSILSIAFSPDGKLLATGDTDDNIRLWNLATGEQVETWSGHTDWVRSISFSPNGELLASGSEDKTVRIWTVATGQCQAILEGHRSWVRSISFSPDGELLASSSEDKTIRIWTVATGKCLRTLTGHTNIVRSVAFSPDGQILASGSSDRTVRLWDVTTGAPLQVLNQHTRGVRSVAFSPDGQTLASGSSDRTIRLWDRAGNCLKVLEGHRGWVWSVQFSPDGQQLVSSSEDHSVRLWQLKSGNCAAVLRGHSSWVRSVKFSPDGQILASGSDDQTVRIWDVKSHQQLKTLQGYARGIRSVAFSPNGQILASGSEDRTVRLWDVALEKCILTLSKHTGRVWSVAFSPDGTFLASGSEDMMIRIWNVSTGNCQKILSGHQDGLHSVAFSPDGMLLVSGSCDRSVRLWDVVSGQCLAVLPGHTDWVWSVAFSPDGTMLASGSSDLTVRLWDVHTHDCLSILKGHNHWIRSIAFSPDGKTLASSSVGRMVRLWDIKTGRNLSILDGFKHGIRSVAFSPDSQLLASGSDDRVVRIWDIQSGQCLRTFEGHTDRVKSVAFSLDGKILASGSNDEAIKLWDMTTGKAIKTLRLDRLYEGMDITDAVNLLPTQKTTLLALGAIDRNLPGCYLN